MKQTWSFNSILEPFGGTGSVGKDLGDLDHHEKGVHAVGEQSREKRSAKQMGYVCLLEEKYDKTCIEPKLLSKNLTENSILC